MNRAEFLNKQLDLVDGETIRTSRVKHKKMRHSPFVFYRGTAQVFYADLAANNLLMPKVFERVPLTCVMGDCHTSNFGFFTTDGSHSENVVFAINDFDDACIGHAYWDVLRYLVSLHLAFDFGNGLKQGIYASDKDYSEKTLIDSSQLTRAQVEFLSGYMQVLETCLCEETDVSSYLSTSFTNFESTPVLKKRYKKARELALGGEFFRTRSSLAKAVDLDSCPLRFKSGKEKFSRENVNFTELKQHFSPYFYDHIIDAVRRMNSGTGSVNVQRYYLLLERTGSSSAPDADTCHIVEVKQQRKAAPLFYFDKLHHQNLLNPAHLTVKCQQNMQGERDDCLDDAIYQGEHYLLRSRHHAKVGIDPQHIVFGKKNALQNGFAAYARACGEVLAKAHCRGSKQSLAFFENMLFALQESQQEMLEIAQSYSSQVREDWRWFAQRGHCKS